jgi:6-phosphofructokinase
MTYAGGSGKQDFDAGSQRNKVYRAVDESRHHQIPCPPQGKEAAKVFEDYRDLLKEDLDVVYVTTPNRSHAEISIAAMEAGRDAGFIALNSGIASGALDILIPEKKDSLEDLFETFEKAQKRGKTSSIVIVAEGERLASTYELAEQTKQRFPDYDIRVSILGHIQRGGAPSCADRVLASRMGYGAVVGLMKGLTNVMAGIRSNDLVFTPIEDAIKKHNEINQDLLQIAEILAM